MRRMLLPLSGLAIFAVVCNHAVARAQDVLFLSAEVSYEAGTFWQALSSPNYVFITSLRQLALFAVPAFLVVSGFFVTFVARGDPPQVSWSFAKTRVLNLLWPYLIWSFVGFAFGFLLGARLAPWEYLLLLLNGNAIWFVPMLMQFYLLSPFMVNWAKHKPVWLLVLMGGIQLVVTLPLYFFPAYERLARYSSEGTIVLFVWWALYFPLGMVLGFHSGRIRPWLEAHRRALFIGAAALGIISVVESELVLRVIGWHGWGVNPNKLSSIVYAVLFILFFLSLDRDKLPLTQQLEKLAGYTYGIYLMHGFFIVVAGRAINRLLVPTFPFLHSNTFIYVPILLLICVGGPLLLMELVKRLPFKKLYSYLFG